jgi:hypothetical protein
MLTVPVATVVVVAATGGPVIVSVMTVRLVAAMLALAWFAAVRPLLVVLMRAVARVVVRWPVVIASMVAVITALSDSSSVPLASASLLGWRCFSLCWEGS